MDGFVKAGKKSDFKDLEGTAVALNGKDVCVARAGEIFYAFDNLCTHAYSRLSGGEVEDGEISCPLHGARFSMKTGEAMTLPATKPVKTYEVQITGDEVFVKL